MIKTRGTLFFVAILMGGPLPAATFEVETHIDAVVSDGFISLREAIQAANNGPGKDVIVMADTLDKDITLALGELLITDDVEIDGSFTRAPVIGGGAKSPGIPIFKTPIIIDANNASRIFRICCEAVSVEIRDMILINGDSGNQGGGGISAASPPDPDTLDLVLRNVTIRQCEAKGLGGGIGTNESNVSLFDCTIEDNLVTPDEVFGISYGGGIDSEGGSLNLVDTEVLNNRALDIGLGGGIHIRTVAGGGVLDATRGMISGNMSTDGGGIFLNDEVDTNIVGTLVSNNTAEFGGGIFADDDAITTLVGTLIIDNTAERSGGGIVSSPNAVLNATGVSVMRNHALGVDSGAGGGGLINNGSATIEESTFESNTSPMLGGGILNTDNGDLSLVGTVIADNTAEESGGGLSNAGSATIEDSTFQSNVSRASFGGLNQVGGGGIFNVGSMTLTDTSIVSNKSSLPNRSMGGGILNAQEGVQVGDLIMNGGEIVGNEATRDGGGISVSGGNATLSDVAIHSNTTRFAGGGVFVVFGGRMTIEDGSITDNSASRGGGVWISELGVVDIAGTEISGNSASGSISLRQGGGGILTQGILGIANATIRNNTAVTEKPECGGGGIFCLEGILSVTDSSIVNNVSIGTTLEGGGGGVFTMIGMTSLTGSTISGNQTVGGTGGGVASLSGVTRVTNSTISGNQTITGAGGGLSSQGMDAAVELIHTTIADNHAATSGGGVHVSDGVVQMGNSILANNTAEVSSPDLIGTLTSLDFNLIGDTSNGSLIGPISNSILDTDARIGPLADNGGPTLTHNLLAGSPAIDAGSSGLTATEGLLEDQRGFNRIANIGSVPDADGGVDMGAVEIIALEIADEVALENSGQMAFTISLSHPPPTDQDVTVRVDTASVTGGADATEDYTPISGGILTFTSIGPFVQNIVVPLVDDSAMEPNEAFVVVLSEAVGATILNSTATGTIVDDDEEATPSPTPSSDSTETPTPTHTTNYDVRPIPPDGIVNALDLIEWTRRVVEDGTPEAEVLFDFSLHWKR